MNQEFTSILNDRLDNMKGIVLRTDIYVKNHKRFCRIGGI
jgi:hypothetical protein